MSELLSAFGLLDFTILRPVLAWRAFFNFPTVSGRGELRILNQCIRGHLNICKALFLHVDLTV
jgi:hypothetical protein